jgi:hypothetical protein
MSETSPTQPGRRRQLAISLRMFMILVLVVGGWMGWEAYRARRQRMAVAAIVNAGGRVEHTDRFTGGSSWAPKWLTSRCGVDHFVKIKSVYFGTEPIPDEAFTAVGKLGELEEFGLLGATTDTDLAHLAASVRTRKLLLHVNDHVTDAGFALLASCKSVEKLNVRNQRTIVSRLRRPEPRDAWLAILVKLPRLRELTLRGFTIGDAGIAHLGALGALHELDLKSQTDLTTARLVALKQFPALRRLKIHISISPETDFDFSELQHVPFDLDLSLGSLGGAWDRIGAESPLLINLGRIQRLQSLTLLGSHYDKFPRYAWERLEELPNLHELNLMGWVLSERDCEEISRLRRLEKLGLGPSTRLVEGGAKHICKMSELKELDCRLSTLTPADTAQIQRALPSLKIRQ